MNPEYVTCDPDQWVDVEGLVRDRHGEHIWRSGQLRAWSRTSAGAWVGHVHFSSGASSSFVAMLRTDLIRGPFEPRAGHQRVAPPSVGSATPHPSGAR